MSVVVENLGPCECCCEVCDIFPAECIQVDFTLHNDATNEDWECSCQVVRTGASSVQNPDGIEPIDCEDDDVNCGEYPLDGNCDPVDGLCDEIQGQFSFTCDGCFGSLTFAFDFNHIFFDEDPSASLTIGGVLGGSYVVPRIMTCEKNGSGDPFYAEFEGLVLSTIVVDFLPVTTVVGTIVGTMTEVVCA